MAAFKKLSEVEVLNEVPEGANAFIEIDGEVKRVPGEGLGGSGSDGGIKTAIIKTSSYDGVFSGVQPEISETSYECVNMTFEEACQIIKNGEPLMCLLMYSNSNNVAAIEPTWLEYGNAYSEGFEYITVRSRDINPLYWLTDSISDNNPFPPV